MAKRKSAAADAIEIRGARQNNLKGVDVDLPLNQLIVVTGPSGSGKSSLAFQTVYAEGQRRYVETFSPYVRQFFDRMDKPQVDEIRGIPPAIAIEQANHVKTTRSTVGTITEINDYLKLLFPRIAEGFCPECGASVKPDTPQSISAAAKSKFKDTPVLVTFGVAAPADTDVADFFQFLQAQGYVRALLYGEIYRTDQPDKFSRKLPAVVDVIQDRVAPTKVSRTLEALEAALHFGKGKIAIVEPKSGERVAFSTAWHCAPCDLSIREPSPGLFSFNNPLGACPDCRGFGRVIGIDLDRALPNKGFSIADGLVKAFQGDRYAECQQDLLRCAKVQDVDIDTPFEDLPKEDQDWIIYGDGGDPDAAYEIGSWYGVKGFFDWLEKRSYKMHVRIFLSRFRSYTTCQTCKGGRLQPEALNFRANGKTLPDLWQLSIDELRPFAETFETPKGDDTAALLNREVCSRLSYLERVGLTYLNLDRSTRTLSGGEVQRVNLTTCLGASLTNTLFVLDEPSIGLHPRDIGRLIEVMQQLRDKGNTLLVVEHEEAVIRAADHLVDVGPGRGEGGGEVVFSGPTSKLQAPRSTHSSLTRDYLTGAKEIEIPAKRRKPKKWLTIKGARQNNLKKLDVKIPLGVFTVVTGVSGSGKSTLVHDVLYQNLLRKKGEVSEEMAGQLKELRGAKNVDSVVMVDQSPLARTPRSTPAVFVGVFEAIRKIFSATPDAKARGLTPGYFSFNSGAGRCERCWGTGFEKVEMQFLSDVFVTCPECEGKRYTPDALEIMFEERSIHDVLRMTVSEAITFFDSAAAERLGPKIVKSLTVLEDVGLGYLRLGQPLNTLSGGEAQRLKLVGHLLEKNRKSNALLIFDEPTTGLHFDDVAMLVKVFQRLVENGDSILVIEHNLEVIKCADWIVDLGPEAGTHGGELVAEGTPEQVAKVKESHTGEFLRSVFNPAAAGNVAEAPATYRAVSKRDNEITVRGAREHNLKNIDLSIPRDEMVVITGLSGSVKSTLAFDILFAEGQRRFLDSMSTFARQFVEQMEKPDVDHVTGLPPTVAIEQRISRGGGKSTVGTVTEVYHFLRLLYAKVGIQHSPATGKPVVKQSASSIVTRIRSAAKTGKVKIMAPLVKARKGFHTDVAAWAERQGYEQLLVDGQFKPVAGFKKLERFKEHTIDVVIEEIDKKTSAETVRDALDQALKIGKQTAKFADSKNKIHVASTRMSCPDSGQSFEELDPRLFSYNSPHGWCYNCRGFGEVYVKGIWEPDKDAESELDAELREERRRNWAEEGELVLCPVCEGGRLNEIALNVRVLGIPIDEITRLSVADAREVMSELKFTGKDKVISRDILPEITQRLRFMEEVGLGYLQLDRSAKTLSGGESQRIRLAAQLGSNLRGVLYVLDEPTIGLHPRDNAKLLDTLTALKGKGNSLVVVEHDEETMKRSDHIVDLGPAAGRFGGEVAAQGSLAQIKRNKNSVTGRNLKTPIPHPMRGARRQLPGKTAKTGWLRIDGAHANNLQNLNLRVPIGRLTVICGISGSGKSSFMRSVLQPAVKSTLPKSKFKAPEKTWKTIKGVDQLEAVYEVDQSPIGKTSRSAPATYIKVFDEIRKLYAQVPESRARGYTASRFSFNTEGGRCETCKGNGRIKLEMLFLPTSYVHCEDCRGLRYNSATLEVLYNGKNIGEVLQMSIDEATDFFEASPKIHRTLKLLRETGLGYLQLGQPSPTLSGGEAQRIKLVSELTRGVGRSQTAKLRQNRIPKSHLYLIEEPSIGLHIEDVSKLLEVLHRLVEDGATVVVIEHNLDIVAEADHVIEIGPEAGAAGGQLVAACTPEELLKVKESRTAPFLKETLNLSGN
ncbi:MAG: excinuclease ABC subunit UvrA [Verrucomicrobiota bacterium]